MTKVNNVPIVPNGAGRCLSCGNPSNGNAYCSGCSDDRCDPNCAGCVMDAVEQGR